MFAGLDAENKKHNKEKTMRIIILCLFAMAVILPMPAQQPFQVTPATTYGAAEKKKKQQIASVFWSATQKQPPLPFNPFPKLSLYDAGTNNFIYDDREVDYPALAAASEPPAAATEHQTSSGGSAMSMGGSSLCLYIELFDDGAKRMSFNSEPELDYAIEESTNLVDWTIFKTVVATETNTVFYTFGDGFRFYRIREGSRLIWFPNWDDFVEQFLYFDAWTPVQGTYHLELYGDGALLYQATQAVPANGFFGVRDGSYNPQDWPFAGYYANNDWEFRVTVTPAAGSEFEPAAATEKVVKKKSRRRNQNRIGVTAQQDKALEPITPAVEEELDGLMLEYFLGCFQGAFQVALNGANLDEFTDVTGVPRLAVTNDWNQLKALLYGTNSSVSITDFHYFGHGANTGIGRLNSFNTKLTIAQLQSSMLTTNAMTYVALDGCRTAQTTDFLKAFIGYGSKVSATTLKDKGKDVRFAWGWKDAKRVAYILQGSLVQNHFDFVRDYYGKLTQRDISGYLFNTYEQAIMFGQHPNNQGVNPSLVNNSEGNSINYVGCYDCLFDQ